MLYILLASQIILMIVLYKKISNRIELEAIKQHNGILLDIKRQLDEQDKRISQIYRRLNGVGLDTAPASIEDDSRP